ncbi:MAG: stage II sporulation protein M [Akkermansiaceae bacterium]|nr:stage II sporulation protein M [Akkermansiaceae bacterium]
MFCFYIYNNIGIDFMTFAGGILGGLGTIFFMVFNGVHIGAATGYAHYACRPDTFYSFVAGHSSFELIAAVISGTAGMVLGMAILKPGRKTRRQAVVDAGRSALPLILGAASMTFLAACIEGFWSAQPLEPLLKYAVGVLFWILLGLYLVFAGRVDGAKVADGY